MHHRTLTRALIAALCAAAAAAAATPAAASAPTPVPASDMRLVRSDVAILTGSGAVAERHRCEWTAPEEDDRPCLAFSGDPQTAVEAILAAGGRGADVRVTSPEIGLDALTTIRRRANGEWVFRGEGQALGRRFSRGAVCSADGRTCARWDARRARSAGSAIRAATRRMRAKA